MNAGTASAVGSRTTGAHAEIGDAPLCEDLSALPAETSLRGASPVSVGIERPRRIDIAQDDVKNGLGQLVLTVVELLRQVVERQAIRRVEGGSLNEAEIERLGTTLMQLSEQMDLLKKHFGLKDEDLNIDLGPLGKLL